MIFDETRDNLIDTENQSIEADLVDDPTDPEHDPIGDAPTEYDIKFDDCPVPTNPVQNLRN